MSGAALLAIAGLSGLAGPAAAQTPAGDEAAKTAPQAAPDEMQLPDFDGWYITALGSYAEPDDERNAEYGAGGGALLGRYLSRRFALEFGGLAFDVKRETNQDLDDFYYAIGPDLLVSLTPRSGFASESIRPFFLLGGGAFHDDVARQRDTTPYINAGLGAFVPLGSKRFDLRLEGRYVQVFGNDANAQAGITTEEDFGELIGSVGLQIALGEVGAVSDLDGDGVRDARDRCPNTPKGAPVDTVGCAIDSDGDGVPDYKDRCPNTPAGVQVNRKGCPFDFDNDGVPNGKDQCPSTPPGVPVNAQGCALDFDNDGVSNAKDQCPNTPPGEDVDAFGCSRENSCSGDCDQDGVINQIDECPGTLPGLEVNEVGCVVKPQTFVLNGVNFEFDKATLTPESRTILDAAAATMRGQDNMRVLIAGHTDSVGSYAYNLGLSHRRAAAVRTYLINNGVEAIRLQSKGFGESEPVATNETDAGRAQNRRVEFRILNKAALQPGN